MRRKVMVVGLLLALFFLCGQGAPITYAGAGPDEMGEEGQVPGEAYEPEEPEEPEEPAEPEEPEQPKEPEEPEETEGGEPEPTIQPVEKYKLEVPKADGEHGYFVTVPSVKLTHVSAYGSTHYRLKRRGQKEETGSLLQQGDSRTFGKKDFGQGENLLTVWMEDETGEKIRNLTSEQTIRLDTEDPQLVLRVPDGFDAWYPDQVTVRATATDTGSPVASLSCRVGEKTIGTVQGAKGEFCVTRASQNGHGVEVVISAKDQAGHTTTESRQVLVDRQAPTVKIQGAKDYQITGKPLSLSFSVQEENVLKKAKAWIEYETVQGKKQTLGVPDWQESKGEKTAARTLSQDGIYQVHLLAADGAGHEQEKTMQVIIDQENPVIRHVDELRGRYFRSFSFDYAKEDIVQDFTSYTYEVRLDGRLYHRGRKVNAEGPHTLEVSARDAAGNKVSSSASFVVDHTAPEILFTNVEDGASYEEEQSFQVSVKDPRDQITQICINGEDQDLSREEADQYTVTEPMDYSVEVSARDRAGNVSEKSLSFSIVTEDSLAQKGLHAIRNLFPVSEEEGEKDAAVAAPVKRGWLPALLGVLLLLGAGIILVILHRKGQRKTDT